MRVHRRLRAWFGAAAAAVAVLAMAGPAVAAGPNQGDVQLIAKVITAEEGNRSFSDQVGVGAVVLNRLETPGFPKTVAGVIFQPGAFTSVMNGYFFNVSPTRTAVQAAEAALSGWDPTGGALYFYDPGPGVTDPWIYNQPVTAVIDGTVYAD
jgi:N-acetylmuramoyl-L-alanine amidase